jgi:hypothetical protein
MMSEQPQGLLSFLTIVPAIMKEQNCTWDEAMVFWRISNEMEAEAAQPSNVIDLAEWKASRELPAD